MRKLGNRGDGGLLAVRSTSVIGIGLGARMEVWRGEAPKSVHSRVAPSLLGMVHRKESGAPERETTMAMSAAPGRETEVSRREVERATGSWSG